MPSVGDRALLLAPLPAIVMGALVAHANGVPFTAFFPNLIAVVVGSLGAVLLWRSGPRARRWAARWLPLLATFALAMTLIGAGIEGVHRWILLGPLRINASTAWLPWLFLGISSEDARSRQFAMALACVAQAVHLGQPDAAQATAFAVGILAFVVGGPRSERRVGISIAVLLSSLAAVTWMRPDPLPAIDHVERILFLTAARGAPWIAAVTMAAVALLTPVIVAFRRRDAGAQQLGAGFALYGCATVGATFFGNYPVPVFGAGAGPVLGWYAMATLIAARPIPNDTSSAAKCARSIPPIIVKPS